MSESQSWENDVLQSLRALLRAAAPGPMPGVLECTTRIGWDDGVSRARLTLVGIYSGRDEPPRIHVFVAVASGNYAWGEPEATAIPLPRYGEARPAPLDDTRRVAMNAESTLRMAIYLLEQVNGDSESLQEEENGSVSFTMAVPPSSAA